MSSRALNLAAVLLLIGWFTAGPALAQENLDAGKTPSQIFAGTCNACHKSPRGLLKTVSPSSLPGFLRQHYTTSPNMAGVLASYLISNGATDTRLGGEPKGAKGSAKEGARQEAKQEARPNAPPQQLDRWGRPVHPGGAAPQETSAPAAETNPNPEASDTQPAQAAVDHGPDGRKLSPKQKLSKRGRPGEAAPKEESTATAEPKGEPKAEAKGEPKSEPKSEPKGSEPKASETAAREEGKQEPKPEAKPEAAKSETAKPADESRSQSAKIQQPADTVMIRPDPVPQVTPAQGGAASSLAAPMQSVPAQAAISAPATEMAVPLAVPLSSSGAPAQPPPPAVTTLASPLPPVQPAGQPQPPISQ